mmetsp:Transcript_27304/g.69485  ORF Transcript_27304/g.69485 Transcript_27304/m.69485 type:complete len:214 (+) Transcript_27304:1057-1698(+)
MPSRAAVRRVRRAPPPRTIMSMPTFTMTRPTPRLLHPPRILSRRWWPLRLHLSPCVAWVPITQTNRRPPPPLRSQRRPLPCPLLLRRSRRAALARAPTTRTRAAPRRGVPQHQSRKGLLRLPPRAQSQSGVPPRPRFLPSLPRHPCPPRLPCAPVKRSDRRRWPLQLLLQHTSALSESTAAARPVAASYHRPRGALALASVCPRSIQANAPHL